jgi:hypothetical protein
MATSNARPGLPNPKSVVAEIPFGGAAGLEAAAPRYRIIRTNEVDAYEKKPTKAAVAEAMFVEAKKKAPGERFGGTSRRAAKLSVADAKTEKFKNVADLIATLASHKLMLKKFKAKEITTDAKSNRVAEEKRNVRVAAWIYAASIEDDNDYHLILGLDPDGGGNPVYMTMELSGLPPANMKSHAALKSARDTFKKYFAKFYVNDLPGKSYDFYDPPIRVDVEGSLFWDASHANGGRPGPQSLRADMPVIWEVHPISKMKLFPPPS